MGGWEDIGDDPDWIIGLVDDWIGAGAGGWMVGLVDGWISAGGGGGWGGGSVDCC